MNIVEEQLNASYLAEMTMYARYMSKVLELETKFSNDQEFGKEVRKLIKENDRDTKS